MAGGAAGGGGGAHRHSCPAGKWHLAQNWPRLMSHSVMPPPPPSTSRPQRQSTADRARLRRTELRPGHVGGAGRQRQVRGHMLYPKWGGPFGSVRPGGIPPFHWSQTDGYGTRVLDRGARGWRSEKRCMAPAPTVDDGQGRAFVAVKESAGEGFAIFRGRHAPAVRQWSFFLFDGPSL